MPVLVDVCRLSRHFDFGRGQSLRAVDDVSLQIMGNEVLGLVGESGSGKSTFGKTLIGLLDKTAGSVRYRGELLPQRYRSADYKRNATRMQMIFQDPYASLNPRMTIAEIIGEGLHLTSTLRPAVIRERVVEWLQWVELSPDCMSRYPHEFSGGQRQRIGIARAMIMAPEFVVCDEPISALDVSVQAQVVNLLHRLQSTMNLTLLVIAHDLSMVHYISDRIAVFYLGALMELATADDLYLRPAHPYTRLLVQSVLKPDPAYEHHRQQSLIQGEVPDQAHRSSGCAFAGRCPDVMDICTKTTPKLITLKEDASLQARQIACHLYGGD